MALHPRSNAIESRWGGPRVALAAILLGAAALRLAGVRYGLPLGGLLDPDELNVVPRSWTMTHGAGADPQWFDYPTLVFYVLAPVEWIFSAPSFLAARLVIAALGVAGVAAAWWLGRRAYGTVAGAVAACVTAVETTHVFYSHVGVTDVPLTLGVTATLALAVAGRLELAGLAAGLATSFKYPGVVLAVPLVVAGWRRWLRLSLSLFLAAAAFVGASPFVAVHAGDAWRAVTGVDRLVRDGWLGFEHDHWAGIAFASRLWHGLGPALAVCVVGLVAALVSRRRPDLVLASFFLVYYVALLPLRAHFDRYTLPLVPPLAALAGRMRSLTPVTLLLLVVPLVWSIRNDARLTLTDTRVVADHWVEAHVPHGAGIAADSPTLPLEGFRLLSLALPGPGRPSDPNRSLPRLRAQGFRYVVVTGTVADRVRAASRRYPREERFYEALAASARRIYYVSSGHDLSGPWVAVYYLSS